jgi:hypothetical protein
MTFFLQLLKQQAINIKGVWRYNPQILIIGTRWKWLVRFLLRPSCRRTQYCRYPLCEIQSRCGQNDENRNSYLCQEGTPGHLTHSKSQYWLSYQGQLKSKFKQLTNKCTQVIYVYRILFITYTFRSLLPPSSGYLDNKTDKILTNCHIVWVTSRNVTMMSQILPLVIKTSDYLLVKTDQI